MNHINLPTRSLRKPHINSALVARVAVPRVVVATFAATLFFPMLTFSSEPGCYEVVLRGRPPYALCKELEKSLNEFCDEEPMVCSLKLSPKYPKLRLPKWKEMDVQANLGLVERLVRGKGLQAEKYSPGSSIRSWEMVKERILKHDGKLARASLDVLDRGEKETVYRINTGFCRAVNFADEVTDPNVREYRKILSSRPVDQQWAKTDPMIYLARYAEVLDNPAWRARAEQAEDPFSGASVLMNVSDVFFYEGRAFLFTWDMLGAAVVEMTAKRWPMPNGGIDETVAPGRTVCEFQYLGRKNR